jgi:hypothetical protein
VDVGRNAELAAETSESGRGRETQDGETDTIDLAKLPPLTLTLNPSTDQNVRPGSTVKYSAKVSGDTTGLTLHYGWYHLNALKVTGDSLYGASPAGT